MSRNNANVNARSTVNAWGGRLNCRTETDAFRARKF
jgi:hypothetical protein